MKQITPCLWFDGNAEEAAALYTSIFPDSAVTGVQRYGPDSPGVEGSVMVVEFRLRGQDYVGLNGGPQFPFTEAVSFQVRCESQAEVDEYWDKLVDGGEPGPCGWLKDRFGLSWQVIPVELFTLISDPDPAAAGRATQAMLATRGKIDLAVIGAAHAGA
jgi:predicted 3-demethylubiquinone-9 3-methyltransferase (glyoxalase superfamily)